ncbi:MAG: ABC transporter ATP-binding protein [Anaerolineae bacterium]|nr:ABC transporter ATP-binding protein [Anaerolineae bacterium]MDW8171267.1 ABC transporter ATP-binding protein [Anaerolineae bacterium]
MSDYIIETHDLKKHYGPFQALHGVALHVPRGAIYGFVGPNGAGKTTTMRILTTLARPSEGWAKVNGYDVQTHKREVRRAIGYMPDEFGIYEDLRVWEYLDFFAACYDIPENERKRLVGELLELVEMSHRREDLVDTLSRGMKQRLSLARTLAHDPQVLILDEPASGLDPRARVEIRELLAELARLGKTIFFSSHILSDLEEICSHIGIIEGGRMVIEGSLDDLKRQLMEVREVTLTLLDEGQVEAVRRTALAVDGVRSVEVISPKAGRARLRVQLSADDAGLAALHAALAQQAIALIGFQEEERSLETLFMRVTKGLVT